MKELRVHKDTTEQAIVLTDFFWFKNFIQILNDDITKTIYLLRIDDIDKLFVYLSNDQSQWAKIKLNITYSKKKYFLKYFECMHFNYPIIMLVFSLIST